MSNSPQKFDKLESLNLESLVGGDVVSGNLFYDTAPGHAPHLDLHVNKNDHSSHSYRLYNPPNGAVFEMQPGENTLLSDLPGFPEPTDMSPPSPDGVSFPSW